jgi:hypothetical protein
MYTGALAPGMKFSLHPEQELQGTVIAGVARQSLLNSFLMLIREIAALRSQ